MPYRLPLSARLEAEEWKVKIFDKEIAEPPHVTILKGPDKWRVDLRTMRFMDKEPPPRKVPRELLELIKSNRGGLAKAWDARYPHNKV